MTAKEVKKGLLKLRNPGKAKIYARFFKTGKGEYGEGDVFWGLTVPQKDSVVKNFLDLPMAEIQKLLKDRVHEVRMAGVSIMVRRFTKATEKEKKKIVAFYLKNTRYINNWDLVDVSAAKILGAFLLNKDRAVLYRLAKSQRLWEKRMAIISTFAFIREGQFEDTLKIAKILLKDKHDLIHKAAGWALREVGKKNQAMEEKFLKKHYQKMPRTMLRYAIERFEESKRKRYLLGKA